MPDQKERAPIAELATELIADVSSLLRKEIALAKAEASEKLDQAISGVEILIAGIVFTIAAVGVLLTALVTGIAALFVQWGMPEMSATTLSAVIVGLIFALIGWRLLANGMSALKARNLTMDRTADSVRRDVRTAKESM
ncbi:phage holin family protein [Rhizobium sp. L1K21]|uniref:phage holin family protein n=1 Tax=Rhizobium sp. L1K21 TaxID=2954933 RepID=UPI002092C83C|nr:phage holin family protein [Rhizobium sp. L1K21]MCO6188628.1 phage holin family protein [Rhizobium sp. L1K21]